MSGSKVHHDYYEILEIPQSADSDTLKASYRRLARLRHPDKNPSATATSEFQLLQEAYSTLIDSNKRKEYDIKYAYTHSCRARSHQSKPQTTNTSTSSQNETQQELRELQIQLQCLENKLSTKEKELNNAQIHLRALNRELLDLQRGIEDIMRQQAQEKTLWAYLTSFFAGTSPEAELQKTQRDVDRLHKIAARSIKENTVRQQNDSIQTHRRAINAIRGNIRSIETKIREREDQEIKKMKEEILRQRLNRMREQEEKKAREAAKEREKRAKEPHEADQARNKQNSHPKETCLHRFWWKQVDGRIVCSGCSVLTRKFAFQCPGCAKFACAPCRDSLKGTKPNWDRRSGASNSRHSKFTSDAHYFGSDWY